VIAPQSFDKNIILGIMEPYLIALNNNDWTPKRITCAR